MLELRGVSKYFSSIPAVDDVSFFARPGEVTGYLGPSDSARSRPIFNVVLERKGEVCISMTF